MSADITIAFVTYGSGDRIGHLERGIRSALDSKHRVVVVMNGAASGFEKQVREDFSGNRMVEIYRLSENLGSAGGFRAAIRLALTQANPVSDYVLLLDDDDLLGAGSVQKAVAMSRQFANARGGALVSMAKQREGRETADEPPAIKRSSFLNFDLSQTVVRRIRRVLRLRSEVRGDLLCFAPYAGLLLPRMAALEVINRDAPDYLLYEDDVEQTFGLVSAGFALVHSSDALIIDMNSSWAGEAGRKTNRWATIAAGQPDFRTYYYLRNRAHFEKFAWRQSSARYWINRSVMLSLLAILCARYGNRAQFRYIVGAIRDGEEGRLGRNPLYPLP
ncbi:MULTISPECIES: glycosyltransferase [Microbacterium]|uniref:Glycosyltransferase, GT2 family n=1 Tax=Microbacterium saccharophilum TaxID=1213358 RepID=A0A7Z7D1P7_9MICO|nr:MULTISPECIES: glycosyltransferase [Microbacterium]SFI55705.1 Glycosyltransferase, GT2 family [Microbacterium saccharophilum]